ncbi:MAG: flagellar biosynthetic protein FliO [bacterium]
MWTGARGWFNLGMGAALLLAAGSSWSAQQKTFRTSTPVPSPTAVEAPATPTAAPSFAPAASPTVAEATPPAIVSPPDAMVNQVFAAVREQWDSAESAPSDPQPDNPVPQLLERTGGKSNAQILGEMLISLAFVILLILALAWAAKRFLVKNRNLGGGHIAWISSYNLSPKSKIHLIRVGNDHFLLGEGASAITLIAKLDTPAPAPAPVSVPSSEPAGPPAGLSESFQDQLSHWESVLDDRSLRQEVNASLVFLKGLSHRLRKKGEQENA